jgi:pilus assembly protein Flp/PilA
VTEEKRVDAATALYGRAQCVELVNLIQRLSEDEEGASLIEYTVLLGILLVVVIVTIGLVGTWISSKWTALQGKLT